MTVSYQNEVGSSTSGGFSRLLFKWQGSIYKLIRQELILFCVSYAAVSIIYRLILTEDQKRVFEEIAFYCNTSMNYIPLSFILGFYVTFVASRWWQQYSAIPWPDKILHGIALHVNGYDEKGRILRRSMVRYLNLSLVLVLRSISSAVKKRFPTLDHLVEAGFMTSEELMLFNMVPNKEFNTYWVPCTWFTALVKEAKIQKRLLDPSGTKLLMEQFYEFRHKCGMLWSYDWVSIPLVYTQVVTIATYIFFLAAIIGRQFVEKSPIPYRKMIDLYIPAFTLLQFFFYMGLLKVAEQLINPFGDDDEDFELNWIIDRHMKVSYLIVDTLIQRVPPLTKDIFFDEESIELPYTEASAAFKKETYRGSVANMVVPEEKQHLILPDIIEEEETSTDGTKRHKSMTGRNSNAIFRTPSGFHLNVYNPITDVFRDRRKSSVYDMPPYPSHSAVSSRANSLRSASPPKTLNPGLSTAGGKGYGSSLMVHGSNQTLLGADSSSVGGDKSLYDTSEENVAPFPTRKKSLYPKSDEVLHERKDSYGPLSYEPLQKRKGSSGPISKESLQERKDSCGLRSQVGLQDRKGSDGFKSQVSLQERKDSCGFKSQIPIQERKGSHRHRSEEELDRLYLPFKDVTLDIEDVNFRSSSDSVHRLREMSVSWMPASLKARLAVKNKPVIKWKPYHRPNKQSSQLELERLDEIPSVILEEESSFMWKTIDEESESLSNTSFPLSDAENRYFPPHRDSKTGLTSREQSEGLLASRYNVSRNLRRKSLGVRASKLHRNHQKSRGRSRSVFTSPLPTHTSLPYLPACKCGQRAISVRLLKSLSEASVFLEEITSKIDELRDLQESGCLKGIHTFTNYKGKTRSVDQV